uniref:UAS domain-containing protein n=1 Tax=Meloidogyne hapla TaxID=6305 RepID=A0A1I8BWH0_MELHA
MSIKHLYLSYLSIKLVPVNQTLVPVNQKHVPVNQKTCICQSNMYLSIKKHVPVNQTCTCQSKTCTCQSKNMYLSIKHVPVNQTLVPVNQKHVPVNQKTCICQSNMYLSIKKHVPVNQTCTCQSKTCTCQSKNMYLSIKHVPVNQKTCTCQSNMYLSIKKLVKQHVLQEKPLHPGENGSARPGTSHSIFEQFRNIPPNKAFSESGEELMEETARTSTSSLIQEKYKQKAGFSPPINSFKKIKLHHREEENGKHDKESNNDRQLAMAGEEAQSTTGGFGQGAKRRKDLRLLFRPPTDLIFYGDWDKALQNARQNRLWLLVNVQNSSEFACAVLNRDIWSSEAVKDIVRTNFLFWQVYHDSSDGMRVRCYYRFETYPALFIIDPRTGEEVLKLTAPDSVTFLENLTSFLSRYPTFEARDQEFKQMALLGKKHPLLCRYNLEREKSSNSPKSPQIINSGHITTSSSDSSCGRKRKQSADDADYIDS